jgi:hypothetical protein
LIALPIWARRPAVRPAPKIMKTTIPWAVTGKRTESSREIAAMIETARARASAGPSRWSGDQSPVAIVIAQAAR